MRPPEPLTRTAARPRGPLLRVALAAALALALAVPSLVVIVLIAVEPRVAGAVLGHLGAVALGVMMSSGVALVALVAAVGAVRRADRARRRDTAAYLELAGTLLVSLDRGGRVRTVNRAACDALGRSADELVGAEWFEIALPEAGRALARASYAEVMAGERTPTIAFENVVVDRDGSRRRVEWHVAIKDDAQGRCAGMLYSGVDVTARREAEAQVARDRRDLVGLRRVAHAVASLDDPRDAIVREIIGLAGASLTVLLEPCEDGGELEITAGAGDGADTLAGMRIAVGSEPSGSAAAFASGEKLFVSDLAGSTLISHRLLTYTDAVAGLYLPIASGGVVRGVILVAWNHPVTSMQAREAAIVGLVGDEVAVALERIDARRKLESAAVHDALTGAANRRAWDRELPLALARARRSGSAVTVVAMDFNGFKALNDTRGHAAGDALLRETAEAWQGTLRQTDLLARLGGDEFNVLLPDCGELDAPALAARLRAVVDHGPGVGVGYAVWDGEEPAAALSARADAALYADKALSRRAVISSRARVAAVRATGLIEGEPVPALDRLAETAAWLLGAPMATVSLVTDERQHFVAECGISEALGTTSTTLEYSYCQHAVATGRPLLIEDASVHPLVKDHPAFLELGVAAYAGVPLADSDGHMLGVLCVLDDHPRPWSEEHVRTLGTLADHAAAELRELAAGAAVPG